MLLERLRAFSAELDQTGVFVMMTEGYVQFARATKRYRGAQESSCLVDLRAA